MIIIVGALSGFTLWRIATFHPSLNARPSVILGSKQSGPYSPIGWLMPSNTRVSTSYVANQSFDHNYMNAYVTVLSNSSYPVQQGTILLFGLYINGQLMASQTCSTDNPNRNGGWASFGTWINKAFTLSMFDCGVSLFKIPFPSGSTLTVTVWSNRPVWVQVDASPTTNSYETFNVALPAQPSTINPMSGIVAPRTITVNAYSD
jgi:hypothetical protein